VVIVGSIIFLLFFALPFLISSGVPVRSLANEAYSCIFLVALDLCCTLALVESWRLWVAWQELRRLLNFLDRLPLRRTMAALRGFSWGSVWRMSGNVLEVRYKVISRQLESMNHTITSLSALQTLSNVAGGQESLDALRALLRASLFFADWYSTSYQTAFAGDLFAFRIFQKRAASAAGTLLAKLLLPAWRQEGASLLIQAKSPHAEKDDGQPNPPPLAEEEHVRNAEEFVCLSYLGFAQNVLGRLRTMAIMMVVLFLSATTAISTYPFDPRQALSMVLI